jgi:hypothetical protein
VEGSRLEEDTGEVIEDGVEALHPTDRDLGQGEGLEIWG